MKVFQERELKQALAHAASGGQAIHLMSGRYAYLRSDTPNCFKGREIIAHLFDQDVQRLVKTIRRLGVRSVRVERTGTDRQHVDLCGKPLERALELARPAEADGHCTVLIA